MKAKDTQLILWLLLIILSGILILIFPGLRNTWSKVVWWFFVTLFVIEFFKLLFFGIEME